MGSNGASATSLTCSTQLSAAVTAGYSRVVLCGSIAGWAGTLMSSTHYVANRGRIDALIRATGGAARGLRERRRAGTGGHADDARRESRSEQVPP
jgi:hypothetical protein